MKLTCFSWTDCQHTVHLTPSGQRVGITEVLDPANRPIEYKFATFACPACTDPDSNQDGVGIRPIPRSFTANASNIEMPVTNTSLLNPIVNEFVPAVQQQLSQEHLLNGNNLGLSTMHNGNYTANHPHTEYNTPAHDLLHNPTPYSNFNVTGNALAFVPTSDAYPADRQPTIYYIYPQQGMAHPVNHQHSSHNNNSSRRTALASLASTPTTLVRYDPSVMEQHIASLAPHDEHKPGRSCPDGSPNCHWHYARWCHENPATCRTASQAITAAFHARGPWKDAPTGWNAAHESCIRAINPQMCDFHAQIHRRVLGSSFD